MTNLLTGDYSAVLQVSEATVNRLLANMHQNSWEVVSNPSFPHSVGLRLGDDDEIDGVRGAAWAQVGVPRMHLIDGSTDSFSIEVGLRIRYRPDDGTTPLPTYSHGTLRATYQITDIPPDCFGWGRVASQYMWLRVVDGSVSFDGEYSADDLLGIGLIDVPTANQQLTNQLAYALANKFAATPQRLSDRFHDHLFKSILEIDGLISEASALAWVPDVPIGGHAVAIPIDLGGGHPSAAAINSVEHALLQGRDFAAAVSRDSIMALVQPAVDQLRAFAPGITVHWKIDVGPFTYEDSTVYHVSIGQASADWIPQDSTATIQLSASGHAHTASILPDFNFSLSYSLHVGFDPASEGLTISAGGGSVQVVGSVALPGGVWGTVASNISSSLQQFASAAVTDPGILSALGSFSGYRGEIVSQLQKLDLGADAHFDEASFYLSGIVFRGWISVSRRWPVDVQFEKVDGDTISALKTWIPGGRVDHLAWTWSWASHTHDPGAVAYDDRFVLRRPPSYTRFGPRLAGATPIPGLDGNGQVCLQIRGVVVNTVTGELDPIEWDPICRQFGFNIPLRPGGWRLLTRNYTQVRPRGEPHPPGPVETGIQELTQAGVSAANTLVVFVHEGWGDGDRRTLIDGVARCTRQDAGLLVALVYPEGGLDPSIGDAAERVRAVGERLEAPMVVSEDVHGSWSHALLVDGAGEGPRWRLLSPDGGLLWKEDERIDAADLAAVLDGCLYACPPASPTGARVAVELTPPVVAGILDVGHHFRPGVLEQPCPPHGGMHVADIPKVVSSVSFVRKDAASSMAEVDRLRAANEGRGALDAGVLLVVDGASDDDVRELSESLGPAFLVVGDPDGSVAAGAGVRAWPTTVPIADQHQGRD